MKKKSNRKTYKSKSKSRKKNAAKPHPMNSFVKLLLLVGAVGFVLYYFVFRSSKTDVATTYVEQPEQTTKSKIERVDVSTLSKPQVIEFTLKQMYNEFGILDEWISTKQNVTQIRLPHDFADILLIHKIINKLHDMDCEILTSSENLTSLRSTLKFRYKDNYEHTLVFSQESALKQVQGKIAIIIDDFGYSDDTAIKKLVGLRQQITIAILPGMQKSQAMYDLAKSNNKEAIIHLPMEAEEKKVEYTPYTVYANMTEDEIRLRIRKALSDYPSAKGVNNHMGSKITPDRRMMQVILQEIKDGSRFFIDSKTSAQSVAYETARRLNLPSAESDLFLERDRDDNPDYLRKKLIALTKIAAKRGYAVAIGHPYQTTIQVLAEELPKLEKQGFSFVSVSELVK